MGHSIALKIIFRGGDNYPDTEGKGDDIYHIMFDKQTRERIRVNQFPAASQLINKLMIDLLDLIRPIHELRHRLFRIDYLSTLSQKIIITLLYHKKLNDEWINSANTLRTELQNKGYQIQIVGRATKQKICIENDYIDEKFFVSGREMVYRQIENSFTQPNALVNIKMLEWAIDATQGYQGDLLELYCGNGNFSLALARNFNKVLATEISKPSVNSAQYNIAVNQINNVQIIRMSAEEFTQAINGVREFNRLKRVDLTSYQCETIFVDPPRSGLDKETLNMVKNYKQILYISCNPESLQQNLTELTKTHKLSKLALFDQFPYTHHMECGVLLERR